MAADERGELLVEYPDIFLTPEVADDIATGDTEVAPADGYGLGGGAIAGIEETDGFAAIREVFGHDAGVALACDDGGLFTEGVLVERQHLVVGEEA